MDAAASVRRRRTGISGLAGRRRKAWTTHFTERRPSSYFARGVGRKAPVTETVLAGDLPRLVVYVDRELTQRTGCTMRNLRNACRVWAWLSGLIEDPGLDSLDELVAVCLLARRRVLEQTAASRT